MKNLFLQGVLFIALVFCWSVEGQLYAQTKSSTISGVIVDDDDLPLPGVAVYDKANPQYGTMSSKDGRYSIVLSSSCKELTFELMGYKTVTLSLKESALVRMSVDVEQLEETVVTGIYTRKADSFTGSVQTINSESLKRAGNKNVLESLKNLDPSLLILENLDAGSNPNVMSSMQIRGASSLVGETTNLKSNFSSNVNAPLFILDGFETSLEKIQDMDMNRVESITILKDASAKAIYGSKGGNGVIVVETKSLDSGRTLISYTGSCSVEMPDLTSYNLCNSLEKLEIERRENYYTNASTPFKSYKRLELYNERLRRALDGEDTYWLSKPLRVGIGNKHSVSVEIGSKELKSFTSFGYSDTEGVMKGSSRKVISGSMNLSYRKQNWVFRNVMSVSSMNSSNSPYGEFSTYASMNPYLNPYDEEGNLVKIFDFYKILGFNYTNPLYDASLNSKDGSDYLDFTDNFYVEYHPIKSLKLVARVGVTTKKTGKEVFLPSSHSSFISSSSEDTSDKLLKKGSYEQTRGEYLSYSADVSAQYNKTFNKIHDIFATAQYNISEQNYSEVTHYATGFPNSNMDNIIFARQYAEDMTPSGSSGLNRNLGFLLTSGYSYDNKYMLDLTGKASASSVFGTDNKWALFWSLGLAWNLHNEQVLKDLEWIKQCKFRFSAGSSGNQNYMTNKSIALYNYSNIYYHGFSGATLDNMRNPNLAWEQKMDYNLGWDFRTGKFSSNVDLYISDTENLVFDQPIVGSTGFTSVSNNMGTIRNKGVELGLSYTPWQKKNSFFSVLMKVSVNDNRIFKLSSALEEYNKKQLKNAAASNSLGSPVIQYVKGMPINSIWAVPSLGIDPITGTEVFLNQKGEIVTKWNSSDLRFMGSSDPIVNGNFGFNSEINGIGASCIFTFYGGGYRYNSTLRDAVENADIAFNVDRRIFSDCWYEPGQLAKYTRNTRVLTTRGATSRFVQADNVLRISSVSLYYEFPYQAIKKIGLSRLRATIYGDNLFTWSSIHIERGTSYPYARTVSFSLNANF